LEHVLALLCSVGHAFAEKRKKKALREYKKLLKKTREEHRQLQSSGNKDRPLLTRASRVSDAATISEQDKVNNQGSFQNYLQGERKASQHKRKPVNKFTTAESEFKKRKMEKEQQIKEREIMIQKHREEVREKMKKRRETFGRLNRRTRKGQPIMANQIEHLLGKIQSQT